VKSETGSPVHAQVGRLDTGKTFEKGKPRKASNILTAKEEKVSLHCIRRPAHV
jgi:hypothetical protein